jgi:hypothetical protein
MATRITALESFSYLDAKGRTVFAQAGETVENFDDMHAAALIRDGRAEAAAEPVSPPRQEYQANFIPVDQRAPGEPDAPGYEFAWAALDAAPSKERAEYEAKLNDLPRLVLEHRRKFIWYSVRSDEEIVTSGLLDSLSPFLKHAWRFKYRCFGFCDQTNQREPIFPASWEHLSFAGSAAQNSRTGKTYSDVLFYRIDDSPVSPELAPGRFPRAVPSRTPDPRNKKTQMIEGLEKALAAGLLREGRPATLTAAWGAMLKALEHKDTPRGMGEDAFAKHCKAWLIEKGIYT